MRGLRPRAGRRLACFVRPRVLSDSPMTMRFLAYFLAAGLTACQTFQPQQADLPLVKQMSVNGTYLAYVEQGHGEVVLFIHGANGDWRTWDELRPIIAARYRFGAPELLPGGDSSAMRSQSDNDNAFLREALKLTPDFLGLSR